jgi:hypothetical protein
MLRPYHIRSYQPSVRHILNRERYKEDKTLTLTRTRSLADMIKRPSRVQGASSLGYRSPINFRASKLRNFPVRAASPQRSPHLRRQPPHNQSQWHSSRLSTTVSVFEGATGERGLRVAFVMNSPQPRP